MESNKTIFETGATSAAVNELILYTDNTIELAQNRDSIYTYHHKNNSAPQSSEFSFLLIQALGSYRREFGRDVDPNNWLFTIAQKNEYCQIYANRFEEWKKERERNQK